MLETRWPLIFFFVRVNSLDLVFQRSFTNRRAVTTTIIVATVSPIDETQIFPMTT